MLIETPEEIIDCYRTGGALVDEVLCYSCGLCPDWNNRWVYMKRGMQGMQSNRLALGYDKHVEQLNLQVGFEGHVLNEHPNVDLEQYGYSINLKIYLGKVLSRIPDK